jgi:hypothetical protein
MKFRIIRMMEYIGELKSLQSTFQQGAVPLQGERDFGTVKIRSSMLGSFPEEVNPAELSPYDVNQKRDSILNQLTPIEKDALRWAIDAVAERGAAGLGAQHVLQELFGDLE